MGDPRGHLGKQQQGAAGLGVGVLVPEVEELRGENGRREEAQEEKAAYGQVLRLLREEQRVRGAPAPLPSGETEASRTMHWWCKGNTRWVRGLLVGYEAFPLWASVSPPGKGVTTPILRAQTLPDTRVCSGPSPVLRTGTAL